jgi:hypothetical protein
MASSGNPSSRAWRMKASRSCADFPYRRWLPALRSGSGRRPICS